MQNKFSEGSGFLDTLNIIIFVFYAWSYNKYKINMANMTMAIQAFIDKNYPRKWKVGNLRLNRFLKLWRYLCNLFDLPNENDLKGDTDDAGGGGGGGGQLFLLW